ncbi:GyrI-like domain-containing protein [Haladaptatus sp. NG-SE-30]
MNTPEFESREPFTVVGLNYRGPNENDEIPQLWEAYGKRIHEFLDLALSNETLGVCYDHDDETGELGYVAGVVTDSDATIPEGMTAITVPEQTYAIFTTTLDTLEATIDEIYEQWLPASEYRRTDGPEFERYGSEFDPDDPASKFDYFVPVAESEA